MNIRGAQRDVICPECGSEQGRLMTNIAETQPYQNENEQVGKKLHYYCLFCHSCFSLSTTLTLISPERIER